MPFLEVTFQYDTGTGTEDFPGYQNVDGNNLARYSPEVAHLDM